MEKTFKLDITDRVTIKIKTEGYMDLFFNREKIGEIVITPEGKQYELEEGFIREEGKIYKVYRLDQEPLQYVEGCDLGWC
jgi:hypothetical protein